MAIFLRKLLCHGVLRAFSVHERALLPIFQSLRLNIHLEIDLYLLPVKFESLEVELRQVTDLDWEWIPSILAYIHNMAIGGG